MSGAQRPDAPRDGGRIDPVDARRLAMAGAIVLALVLLLVFIVDNSDPVRVSFVFFDADISLIWVILLSAVIGWIVGFLLARLIRRRFLSRPG
ncbi:MAG TPA: LapA family protein [Miltoncostaeaceae bacterium]|nr:LapA family protein [Miltoncostaeaceae bacterium]